jgi:hypothetical protein
MDKPLPDKDKKENRPGDYNPALTEEAFEKSGRRAWKDSVQGRGLIRLFSRGVMGTVAFALGGLYAGKKMANYSNTGEVENWVQGIARFYDNVFGRTLKAGVNAIGYDGEKFVNNFRPNTFFPGYKGKPGRSLGHEVVTVTFDFASMSIGDFWGRKIAHTIDPKGERPKWKRKDGSIDWKEGLKTFGKNWWTAVTYSAGEDWAVAVPYVLTMRHIGTPLIDKMVPGFRYDFDLNGNGGGLKINDQGRITGNFTTAGLINIWERFTTYNVGTLLFREAYRFSGNRIKHWWQTGEMPTIVASDPDHPAHTGLEKITDGAKQFTNWFARGVVKALVYMIPAVPFFWITRVPQHKFKGPLIHPEKGPLMYMKEGKLTAVRADTMPSLLHPETRFTDKNFNAKTPVYFNFEHPEPAVNPFSHGPIEPNAKTWGPVDALLNPIAKAADKVRETLRKPIGTLFAIGTGSTEGKKRAGTYIMASMAYTPYFWAKSDWLADRLDYGRMDVAVDRTLAAAANLDVNEGKAGIGEMWQAIKRQPLKDPVREDYAQCREANDETPPDSNVEINNFAGGNCKQILKEAKSAPIAAKPVPELSWRERMVSGKKPEIAEHANTPTKHAEREEMRKALEELHPPTNSIN